MNLKQIKTNIKKAPTNTTLTGINVDKRKHYVCVVDVETTSVVKGDFSKPLIYDLGFAITDKKGNVAYKRSLLVREVLCNGPLMVNAYYAEKLPKYMQDLADGLHELVSWADALDTLGQALGHFNVKTIAAYNYQFDKRALKATHSHLTGEDLVIDIENELCLWSLACETIFSQKSYPKIAVAQGWYKPETENLLTNAEICHRYITGDYGFKEEHTGLSDVLIEVGIMAHAFRQKKKVKSGVLGGPWAIVKRQHKWYTVKAIPKHKAYVEQMKERQRQYEANTACMPVIEDLNK